jgi:insertion element IS1 protein InsB
MIKSNTTCIDRVGENFKCPSCNGSSIKYGFSAALKQRYFCKTCNKTFVHFYTRQSYRPRTNQKIIRLLKEGLGISNMSRYLRIAKATILHRILKIAEKIKRPPIILNCTYEVDELWTYIKSKEQPTCIIYALCRENNQIIDFTVGNRTNLNISKVINTLILSNPIKIYTDKLSTYKTIIDQSIHSTQHRGTNHIERKNLSLRTHMKRLNRRTICFSKSMAILSACLRIYFWS